MGRRAGIVLKKPTSFVLSHPYNKAPDSLKLLQLFIFL